MLLKLKIYPAICANGVIISDNHGLTIKGNVAELGKKIPCRIRLFEKITGHFIFETTTDKNGSYEFNHLTNNKFFIVAHHPANQFNAVIQDNVVPK